jgi:hypothetical protein
MQPSTKWRLISRLGIPAGLLLALTAGCGTNSSASLAEVAGTVTMDGKALSGLTVTFYPVGAPDKPRQAFSRAVTDEAGKYTLTCEDNRPGAIVGKHKVVVDWPKNYDRGTPSKPAGPPIPTACTAVSSTPIEKEVVAGPNSIVIEIPRQ